mgnify:CR=1 FL=1
MSSQLLDNHVAHERAVYVERTPPCGHACPADEDSATGGPDLVRGIYPTMATITADGFTALERDEIAERFRSLLDSMDGGLAS